MSDASLPKLAQIPAGEFLMGAADGDADERPVHCVYLSDYSIGCAPITQEQYARFVLASGYPPPALRDLPLIASGGHDRTFVELARPYAWSANQPPPSMDTHPVVLVRVEDALAYCRWLAREIRHQVRLPTEAEWEKAARGGLERRRFPSGDSLDVLQANFLTDASRKDHHGTRPAARYPPNGYGIYDMAGNVWEWVSDWYGAGYYHVSEPLDPRGPKTGTFRIVRGGSWVNMDLAMLRCSYRHKVPPDTYAHSVGFRIVCPGRPVPSLS